MHFAQGTFNIDPARFNDAIAGIWNLGGYVLPVGANNDKLNVVADAGIFPQIQQFMRDGAPPQAVAPAETTETTPPLEGAEGNAVAADSAAVAGDAAVTQ
jgi:hypothetical protein